MEIMDENYFHLLKLSNEDYSCSQLLMQMALDDMGRQNPELVRSMGGLVAGIGHCGRICGALTSGACLISYFAGKGSPDEVEDSRVNEMIAELVAWFEETFTPKYGGINCNDLLDNDYEANHLKRCPEILLATNAKVQQLLAAAGSEIYTGQFLG